MAARSSGVNPKRMVLITIILSGAIAGLVGMGPLLGDPQHYRYSDQFPLTLAFSGLVAGVARSQPPGRDRLRRHRVGGDRTRHAATLQKGFPQEIGRILQGTFLLTAVIVFEVMRRRALRETVREAAVKSNAPAEGATP